MAKVDGEFSEDERQIIDTHCLEMHIDNNNYETDMSQDDVIKQLQNSLTHEEQKMVFLELIATIMADDIYHEKEKNLTNKLADVFDIDDKGVKEAFSIIKDMKAVYERCSIYFR